MPKHPNQLFSARTGHRPPQPIQHEDLDKAARNQIYNALDTIFKAIFEYGDPGGSALPYWQKVAKTIVEDFFSCRDFSTNRLDWSCDINDKIQNLFEGDWWKIFDFIEFLHRALQSTKRDQASPINIEFTESLNRALEYTLVGYKFSSTGVFVPTINNTELEEIDRAAKIPFNNANQHLKKAIDFFSKRTNPDYRNCVKEAVAAIESLVNELSDDKTTNLKKELLLLKNNGAPLCPSFINAVTSLYGFASNAPGVRHGRGSAKQETINQNTARFMLVTCSAIVNFLIAQSTGIKK